MAPKKKLIEVALPLEKINQASVHERSVRHRHPNNLHPWWSRKPLSTCRAVLFCQLVDDPSSHPDQFPSEKAQKAERDRLFDLVSRLVIWENSNDQTVLAEAYREILKSSGPVPPSLLDPFCGGGSIPLEAQRLGLETYAGDLNPVSVLITRALTEIPSLFASRPPVNPRGKQQMIEGEFGGTQGLAEDIDYYGRRMRDEAERRIGYLYPKVRLPEEYGGGEATVIAWLWVRTVASPNPACSGAHVPLTSKWWLSNRPGKKAWIEPIVDKTSNKYRFEVRTGDGRPRDGTVNRRGAICLLSGVPIPLDYVRAEGKAGRMGARLMAIAADGPSGRVYFAGDEIQERIAECPRSTDVPTTDLPEQALGFRVQLYGMRKHTDLFTARQLNALAVFNDLVLEARLWVLEDSVRAGLVDDGIGLEDGGLNATAYADAIATYLALTVDKLADLGNSLNRWEPVAQCPRQLFSRQAVPMIWDYAEGNPLGSSSGSWAVLIDNLVRSLRSPLCDYARLRAGHVTQMDAASVSVKGPSFLVSTDPPYYNNIGYADLSDFFYIWLRRALMHVYPKLLSTVLVPKAQELVATPHRFGGDYDKARASFEEGLVRAFSRMKDIQDDEFPLTIYYAFKQSETDNEGEVSSGVASTGWESMLEALLRAGFTIVGTWPIRTEMGSRMVGQGTNALASSIVLVCRPRATDSARTTRREFFSSLRREMPYALNKLQEGSIAPVDLAQAALGPGMAVFSRYSKVIEADGSPMRVRTALALINQVLDEYLSEQEGDYDPDTRWAVAWFEQYGTGEGPFGVAETLSKAKNTSVQGLQEDGILTASGGKVKLLRGDEMPADWDPATDRRPTVWEAVQHLIRRYQSGGDKAAAELAQRLGPLGDAARDLAYRLYSICERKGWASEGYQYNALVAGWPEIVKEAGRDSMRAVQDRLIT